MVSPHAGSAVGATEQSDRGQASERRRDSFTASGVCPFSSECSRAIISKPPIAGIAIAGCPHITTAGRELRGNEMGAGRHLGLREESQTWSTWVLGCVEAVLACDLRCEPFPLVRMKIGLKRRWPERIWTGMPRPLSVRGDFVDETA